MPTKDELFVVGQKLVRDFCDKNLLPEPNISKVLGESRDRMWYTACAYYRVRTGIRISLDRCASPAGEDTVRNWNWLGNTVDREPAGVLAHELGHHVDCYFTGVEDYKYYGLYGKEIFEKSGEEKISSYNPNYGEWFAEMFRVFVTNPELLRILRPRTFDLLMVKLQPITQDTWDVALGPDCPQRVFDSIVRKVRRACYSVI